MRITEINKVGRTLTIIMDNGESAELSPFGNTIYTSTSDGLKKSSLDEFKKDVKKYNFDENKLRKAWIASK